MFNRNGRRGIVLIMICGIFTAGCTRSRVETVARLNFPQTERMQPVRHDGVYVAKWTFRNRTGLTPISGSRVFAMRGASLGFEQAGDGTLVAIHGDERIPLESPPADARYVVWHHECIEPTRLGRETAAVAHGTIEAAKFALLGGLLVGLVILAASDDGRDHCHHRHCRH